MEINKMSEEQKKDFEALYEKYMKYVFKYEVHYLEDFESDNSLYDKDWFNSDRLHEDGLMIKVVNGY